MVYKGFHTIERIKSVIKGKEVFRERLVIKDAVGALVIDANNKIGLVSQFRPSAGVQTLEIPAGIMDKESLNEIETLLEELEEECDIKPTDLIEVNQIPFHKYLMMAGSSDAKMSIFEIRVKPQVNKKVNDVDVDEIIWISIEEMEQLVLDGKILDSKTLLAFHYAQSILL